jgi:hypothetical protein
MPPVRFEPTISVLEWAKTVRALDRAATAIGMNKYEYFKAAIKIQLLYDINVY